MPTTGNGPAPKGKQPSPPPAPPKPLTVEYKERSVIEDQLLVALASDKTKVAILATKEDCEMLAAALHAHKQQMVGHDPFNDQWKKIAEFRDDIQKLIKLAFK